MSVRVPGDKSLTQRALILSALSEGESRISGLLHGGDAWSTADALRSLGVDIPELPSDAGEIRIEGVGLRGLGAPEKFVIIRELAEALGGQVGASRPVTDSGWLPPEHQVGSSGVTVSPKLYIAAGISGAIQHIAGMRGAGFIIALNKDPDAPIFQVADVGVVGDLFELVPALTRAVQKARG